MIISDSSRLLLYILMAVLPVWTEFFTKSSDFSLRGLAMPILASINAAVVVTAARTRAKNPDLPPQS